MELQALALRIIETICEQKFSLESKNERIPLKNNIGRLSFSPFVALDSISVRCRQWMHADVFGATDWMELHKESVDVSYPMFVVSGGVLDSLFDEADVTYFVGFEKIPGPINQACELLVPQLRGIPNPQSYAIMSLVTPEILNLISPFTKNGGESVGQSLFDPKRIQTSSYRH